MFDSLGNFVQTALGILTLASLAGLGLMRSKVIDLRETISDIRGELGDKGRQRAGDQAEIARLRTKVITQDTDIAAIGRVVTGEAHWVAIGAKLDEHHEEAKIHWRNDEQTLRQILAALKESP